MSDSVALIYSQGCLAYDFGPLHPMNPVRLLLTAELMGATGLLDTPGLGQLKPKPAGDDDLESVHDSRYIEAVRRLSAPDPGAPAAPEFGLGLRDNPVFAGMHQAAALIAGGSLTGAKAIIEGKLRHAFNIAGGLHHAHRARASGFCVYNDAAVAIAWLRRHHDARVLYLDFDAHHGDGVQELFYSDPQVMTVSFHESGRFLFPGSGFIDELGAEAARGYSVNLPLPMGTPGDVFLEAYEALVPPLARAFSPDLLVTQLGCDGHYGDPLTHMALTVSTYQELAGRLHRLAHEVAGGRWLALGGGGYQAYTVVPRAWTAVMAEMAGASLGDELPEDWRRLCLERGGQRAPRFLIREEEDPPPVPAGLGEEVRQLAGEVRERVFPLVGA